MKKIKLSRLTTDDPMEVTLEKELFKIKNKYQFIEIVQTKEFGKCLLIDGLMQASETDHEIYDERLISNLSEKDTKVLILGGGDGFVASTILKRYPDIKEIHIVDIDEDVANSCNKFFARPPLFGEKVKFHIEDAVKFLERNQESERYSAVIFDFTDIPVVAGGSIKVFYEQIVKLAKRIVLPDGWISIYAGSPGATDKYFNVETFIAGLFEKDYDSIVRHTVFVPCFGEESVIMTIRKQKNYIYDLRDRVLKSDLQTLGGKGFSLHELIKNNFNVPDAFVISSEMFYDLMVGQNMFDKVEGLLTRVTVSSSDEIQEISAKLGKILSEIKITDKLRENILNAFNSFNFSKVSIRSSATLEDGINNAWAGQLESFLNISQDQLLESVKKCWLSLYSERALVYMKENKFLDKKIGVAVVIQKMIDSEVSGVGFSIDPANGDVDTVAVESIYGLGEFMVGGLVTPDSHYISRSKRSIVKRNLVSQKKQLVPDKKSGTIAVEIKAARGTGGKMTDSQYLDLADQIVNCETLFGYPQDVEWALKDGRLYILQSRPITAVSGGSIADFGKYTKIYTVENIFPPLFMDLAIKAKYLPFDGLFLFDNYKTTLLVENDSLLESKAIGSKLLLSPKYFSRFDGEITEIKNQIRKIKSALKKVKDKKGAEDILNEYLCVFERAIYQYGFTEYFYTSGAEERISKKLEKELGQKFYPAIVYDLISEGKEIKISKEIKRQISLLKKAGEGKLKFRGIMNELAVLADEIFGLVSPMLRVDADILEFLTLEEIRKFLNGELSENLAKIIYDSRKEYFAQKVENGNVAVYQDQEAKNLIWRYKAIGTIPAGKKWVGRGVFAGFYTGIIEKVPYFMDTESEEYLKYIRNFKEGDILLARSTGPELTPVIKKAGAIISEEGGIMSHAAVVCREFKKPGVVGIPNIFDSLNDGARVYVDGGSGTVIVEEENRTGRIE